MLKRDARELRAALAVMKPGETLWLSAGWEGFIAAGNVMNAVRHQLKQACPCTYKDYSLNNHPDGVSVYRDADGCRDLLRSM